MVLSDIKTSRRQSQGCGRGRQTMGGFDVSVAARHVGKQALCRFILCSYDCIAAGGRRFRGGGVPIGDKGKDTHVCPHCVLTGLSKISRQTGHTNSDTSPPPSDTFFLCWAALKPPSIAISFLHWISRPPLVPVTSPAAGSVVLKREGGVRRAQRFKRTCIFFFFRRKLTTHRQNPLCLPCT